MCQTAFDAGRSQTSAVSSCLSIRVPILNMRVRNVLGFTVLCVLQQATALAARPLKDEFYNKLKQHVLLILSQPVCKL